MTRWGWARLAAWIIVVAVGSWGIWSVRHQATESDRDEAHRDKVEAVRSCHDTNGNRDDLRRALADVFVDNLVEGRPVDPAELERRRRGLREDLEREFPNEDCEGLAARLGIDEEG